MRGVSASARPPRSTSRRRRRRHVGQQHLAARRGVQRGQLPHPVVRRDRRGAARLVEVDDEVRTPHRDVDGLTEVRGQSLADRPGLLRDVESGPVAALASRRMPKPSRYLAALLGPARPVRGPRARSSNRNAVDLCTPMSAATSLTPASPRWARISSTLTARSTDCPRPSLRLLLMTQLYELEHLLHIEKRDAHCAVIALTQEDSPMTTTTRYDFVIVGGGSAGSRAGQPAFGRPGQPGPGAGGRPQRLPVGPVHPDARRADRSRSATGSTTGSTSPSPSRT